MEEKHVKPFLGKRVKLVRCNDFVITGLIEDVYEDSILFITDTERALIRMDDIKAIHEKRKNTGERKEVIK